MARRSRDDVLTVTVGVLAYGPEPDLVECVEAVLDSSAVAVRLRLVDNGCSNPRLLELVQRDGVELVSPGANTGFAGGCNLALRGAESDVVAVVNSDAVLHADALRALAQVAERPEVGIACADVRLRESPELLNTAGNPVHLTGLAWAGGLGEPARPGPPEPVAAATGAVMALRTEVWEALGGFEERYFAYHEDVELSLRCWGSGLQVLHVPAATAVHRYEFSRNAQKVYLLERNRLVTVLTVFPWALLVRLLPVLVGLELAMLPVSARGGWLAAKLRGYRWLLSNSVWLRRRRRHVQQQLRRDADLLLADVLTPTFAPVALSAPPLLLLVCNSLCRLWWSRVRPSGAPSRKAIGSDGHGLA